MDQRYYFEGADPTDLTKVGSEYIKRLSIKGEENENTVFVSPKVDGVRVILYHKIRFELYRTKKNTIYDEDVCHMITRRGEQHIVKPNMIIPYTLKTTPFIFDIEIVHYNNPFIPDIYYIMDILHLEKEDLRNVPFEYRLNKLIELDLSSPMNLELPTPENQDFIIFKTTPYKVYNPEMKMKEITSLVDVATDGVVFGFAKDWIRQSRKRFKVEDTIDFQIMHLSHTPFKKVGLGILVNRHILQGPSRIMNRFMNRREKGRRNDGGSRITQQTVEIFSPLGIPQTLDCVDDDMELEIGAIYECRYNLQKKAFECVRRRYDKRKPNKLFIANFIFNEIIKKKHLINPFQKEEEDEKDEPDSSSPESHSSNPESM